MTHADRMAEIRKRLDALPDFIGIPAQGIGGWLMSPDGNAQYVEATTTAFHEYVAHAYGDLTYLMARIIRYGTAMEHIRAGIAGDTACEVCLREWVDETEEHWESILIEALKEPSD